MKYIANTGSMLIAHCLAENGSITKLCIHPGVYAVRPKLLERLRKAGQNERLYFKGGRLGVTDSKDDALRLMPPPQGGTIIDPNTGAMRSPTWEDSAIFHGELLPPESAVQNIREEQHPQQRYSVIQPGAGAMAATRQNIASGAKDL